MIAFPHSTRGRRNLGLSTESGSIGPRATFNFNLGSMKLGEKPVEVEAKGV